MRIAFNNLYPRRIRLVKIAITSFARRCRNGPTPIKENSNGLQGQFIGAAKGNQQIAVEIKEFRGQSAIASLEQAIGQYMLYRLLLDQIDPARRLYLAVSD
ncbi:MAG: element excision factor XisH family protein, partial [Cyanobacteria bacterium J06614_10]